MLTIQYLPHEQIMSQSSEARIKSILSILKNDRIVIIDGRLSSSDEASLIRETMNGIDDDFNGVEIAVMHDNHKRDFMSSLKQRIATTLIGDRGGITFIGPAKIISELRQHPENVELHFQKEYLLKHLKVKTKSVIKKNESENLKKLRE